MYNNYTSRISWWKSSGTEPTSSGSGAPPKRSGFFGRWLLSLALLALTLITGQSFGQAVLPAYSAFNTLIDGNTANPFVVTSGNTTKRVQWVITNAELQLVDLNLSQAPRMLNGLAFQARNAFGANPTNVQIRVKTAYQDFVTTSFDNGGFTTVYNGAMPSGNDNTFTRSTNGGVNGVVFPFTTAWQYPGYGNIVVDIITTTTATNGTLVGATTLTAGGSVFASYGSTAATAGTAVTARPLASFVFEANAVSANYGNCNFTGFTGTNLHTTFPGWTEGTSQWGGAIGSYMYLGARVANGSSSWTQRNFAGTAALNLYSTNQGWLISPSIIANASSSFSYSLAYANFTGGATPTAFDATDTISIYVSNNNGLSWTRLETRRPEVDFPTNTLSNFSVSLSAYAGQKIMVAVAAKRASGSTSVDVDVIADNFNLTGDSWANLAFETITSPIPATFAGTCANSSTQTVLLTLRNRGNAAWDYAANPVTVSVTATPPTGSPVTLTGTLNTGSAATNATSTFTLSPALDMSAGGTYSFSAPTLFTSANDGFSTDNTIPSISLVTSNPQSGNYVQTFGLGSALPAGWQTSGGASFTVSSTGGNPASRAGVTSALTASNLTSPRVLGLGAQSHVRFQYNFSSIVAGAATTIQLQVSTNCGTSWTNLGTAISSTAQPASATWYTSTPQNISSYSSNTNLRFQLVVLRTGATANTVLIDNFEVFDFLPFDLSVVSLTAPTGTNLCPNPTQTLSLNLRNEGGNAWDFATNPVTLRVNWTNPTGGTGTITHVQNTGSLPVGTTSAFPLSSQTLSLVGAGTWTFSRAGAISSGVDGNAANNDLPNTTVSVRGAIPAPFVQDWGTGTTTPTGWTNTTFSVTPTFNAGGVTYTTGKSGSGLSANLYSSFPTANTQVLISSGITATSIFQFDYRWIGFSGLGLGTNPSAGDNIVVGVSTDCGTTFTPLSTIVYGTATENAYLTSPAISLSAYAGQTVIIRLLATRVSAGDYFLTLDNIGIPVDNDLAISGIALPTASGPNCANAAQQVQVTLANTGLLAWNFATNNATVSVDITYPNATTVTRSVTINSGTLAVGATANYTLDGTIDFTQSGNYTFAKTGAITAAADQNPNNHDLPSTIRTAVVAAAAPHFVDFGTGTTTPTNYVLTTFSVSSGIGNPGSAARVFLSSFTTTANIRTALIGPIASNHSLRFDLTWTFSSANPGPSDNLQVQVSTDCGSTFTTLQTITLSTFTTSGVWGSVSQSLSAYNGQNIFVRLVGNWAQGSYSISVDNIFIGNATIPFCLATTNYTAPTHNSTNASLTPQLTWTAPAGPAPTGYKLYLGTDGDITSTFPSTILFAQDLGNVLTYTVTTALDPLTAYNWLVVPYGTGGDATPCFSGMRTFTTGDGKPSCIPTAGIAPTNASTNRPLNPVFSWNAPTSGTQPTGYRISIGTTAGTPTDVLPVTTLGNVLTYTYSGPALAVNTQYFWRVTPFNAQGDPVATCNTFSFTTTTVATPGQAALSTPAASAVNISFSNPAFTWTAPTAGNTPTGYKFYLGTDGGGSSLPTTILNGVNLGNVLTYNYSGAPLAKGTLYYWAVVATNSFGDATGTPTIRSFTTGFDPFFITTSVSSATFTSIMGTGSTFTWTTPSFTDDDEGVAELDLSALGFNGFMYQGIPVTTLTVGINGLVRLNGTITTSTFTNSFSSTTNGYLAPFWDDLQTKLGAGNNNGACRYLLTGTPGNQVLTIEWNDMRRFLNPAASLNFQVKLYEADDKVEFVYGTMALFNGNASAAYDYTLGITAFGISGTPVANEIVTQQFANTNNFSHIAQNSLTLGPVCGSMVTFEQTVSANLGTDAQAAVTNTTAAAAEVIPVTEGVSSISFCRVRRTALSTQTVNVCSGAAPPDDAAWFRFDVTAQTAGQNFTITANGAGGTAPVIQLFSDAGTTLYSGNSCSNIATAGNTATLANTAMPQGTYWFRVYHQGTGRGTDGSFAISVYRLIPPPANDDCSGAITLTVGAAVTNGTFAEASPSSAPAACSGLGGNPADDDVWYTFVAATGATTIEYQPQAGVAMQIEAWTSPTCITAATSTTLRNCLSTSTVEGQGGAVALVTSPGTRYYLRCYNRITGIPFSANYGFTIRVSNRPVPANDNCAGALTLTVGGSNTTGNLANAMPADAPSGCSGTADDDIWYKFTATSTSTVMNYSYSTGMTLSAEVWFSDTCIRAATVTTGRQCLSMSSIAGSTNNEAVFNTVVGGNYYIRFYNPIAGDPAAGVGSTFTFRLSTIPAFTWTTAVTNNAAYVSIANDPSAQPFSFQGVSNDDVLTTPLDLTALGFTGFTYQGSQVTGFTASSNGFMTFNTGSTNTGITNALATNVRCLAPLWDDLFLGGTGQAGSMRYLISGTSPNQVLTVEWIEVETFTNQGPSLNFQIKLYEADDRIEFNYGNMVGFNGTNIRDYTYSLGLSGRLSGQVIAQQTPRVRNFGTSENTNLDIVPSCNSRITFTPAGTNNLGSEAALSYSNISCASATPLTVGNGTTSNFCTVYRTTAAGAAASPTSQNNGSYFSFTLGGTNTTSIVVNGGGNMAPVVELLSSCTNIYGGNATASATEGQTATLNVTNLPAGSYLVRVYNDPTASEFSTSNTAGIFSIAVFTSALPPANDQCSGATNLTLNNGSTGNVSGSTKNATGGDGIPTLTYTNGGLNPADDDVWYSFTATATNPRITLTGGAGFIPVMEIFSASCPTASVTNRVNLSALAASASGGSVNTTLTATVGTVYYIRIFHRGTGIPSNPEAPFTLNITNLAPNCPTLTAPAANATVGAPLYDGQAALSWSAATGTQGAITYQVYLDQTNPPQTLVATVSGTSYTATGLLPGGTYFWQVRTVSTTNGTSTGCTVRQLNYALQPGVPPCVTPTAPAVNATAVSLTPTISWPAVSSYDATGLIIQVSANSNMSSPVVNTTINLPPSPTPRVAGSYTVPTGILANNTTYYYTVIPRNSDGITPLGCVVRQFSTVTVNDNCPAAINVAPTSSCSSPVSGDSRNSTQSLVQCAGPVGAANDDVWFKFTANATLHVISVTGGTNAGELKNPVIELFNACSGGVSLGCSNDATGAFESITVGNLSVGVTYYYRVYSASASAADAGTFTTCVLGTSSFNGGNPTASGTFGNVNVGPGTVLTITGDLTVANMTVQSGATLVINSGVTISGSSFTLAPGATLNITDPQGITVNGVPQGPIRTAIRSFSSGASFVYNGTGTASVLGSALPSTVASLTINASSPTTFTPSGATGVTQVLTVGNDVTLNLGSTSFTIASTATGTARIAPLGTGTISGSNITVNRFLTRLINPIGFNSPGSHYLVGSPVTSATVGGFASGGNTLSFSPTSPSVYNFSPSTNTWTAVTNPATPITPGRGMRVWFRTPFFVNGSSFFTQTGPVTTGTYNVNYPAGFNIAANPYPSPIDFGAVNRTNVNNSFWIWNFSILNYVNVAAGVSSHPSLQPGNILASGQGFFIEAPTAGSIEFEESDKVASLTTSMTRQADPEMMRIKVSAANNAVYDMAAVVFRPNATVGKDVSFDGIKMEGSAINISTEPVAGLKMAVNSMPQVTANTILPISLNSSQVGAHTLSFQDMATMNPTVNVFLVDNFLGTVTGVSEGSSYNFDITADPATFGSGRFQLVFTPQSTTGTKGLASAAMNVFPNPSNGQDLGITLAGFGDRQVAVKITDMIGKVVFEGMVQADGMSPVSSKLPVNLRAGIYNVTCVQGDNAISTRLVVNP